MNDLFGFEDSKIQEKNTSIFSIFWKAYPRKVSKGAAEKMWKRIKNADEILPQMLRTLEVQKKSEQWRNREFIPHPATWLNRKQWLDELQVGVPTVNQDRWAEKKKEMTDLKEKLWAERQLSPKSTNLSTTP